MAGIKNNETEKPLIGLLWRYMSKNKSMLWLMFFIEIASIVMSIVPPIIQQIYTDNILPGKNPEWFVPTMLVYCILIAASISLVWFLGCKKNLFRVKFNIEMNSEYIWHAMRMPMQKFSVFTPSQLVSRIQRGNNAISKIQKDVVPMFVCFIIIAIVFALMLTYCWQLAFVCICSVLVSLISMVSTSKFQKEIARQSEFQQRAVQSTTMSTLQNIETIKSVGGEMSSFSRWQGRYVRSLNSRVSANKSIVLLGLIPMASGLLGSAIVLILGAWYILKGTITPGILLLFQGFMASTTYPMLQISRTMQEIFSAHNVLETMDDVMEEPCNIPDNVIEDISNISGNLKLSGLVELKNVTFGFDRNAEPLLKDFSLTVNPGESVALVGMSGCGKSTIAKLISGLYEPWKGEVLFDGKRKNDIPRIIFNNSVSVINQDIILFEGSVADNIKMWDDSIEDFSMIYAANCAQIHNDIAMRDGAYSSKVIENGKNYSGGQRQRIEIATALAKEPTIMIMDEATSALDTAIEEKVMQAIRALGITLIIIAHRLSTIRDCDNILVMEYGKVLQRGRHEQLMQDTNGLYYKLNSAQ